MGKQQEAIIITHFVMFKCELEIMLRPMIQSREKYRTIFSSSFVYLWN